jgi:hypothetical protein
MKKIKIICIITLISGIGLFICIYLFSLASTVSFWCTGLACSLIILGLGYLINTLLCEYENTHRNDPKSSLPAPVYSDIKQKAGYLVCKIMNILLCVYLLILNQIQADPAALILGIALVLIQYLLDLSIQIYLYGRKKDRL